MKSDTNIVQALHSLFVFFNPFGQKLLPVAHNP